MPRRLYAICCPASQHYEELLAPGVISVIESPQGRRAPPGALILTDAPSGLHGLIAAERADDGGWVIGGQS